MLTLSIASRAKGPITVEAGFLAMEQVGHFEAVMDIGGGDAGAMDRAAPGVQPDLLLHAELPPVSLVRLALATAAYFKQAPINPLRMFGVQGKVDALAVPGGTRRARSAGPYDRSLIVRRNRPRLTV